MSSLEAASPFAVPDEPDAADARFWVRLDRTMSRMSERLNPILVKEARQALKSKQFSITFTLLLFCGWAVSIVGVAYGGVEMKYGANGPTMFMFYFMILALPMLVIVPLSAFYSLSTEYSDGTFELLSVTTLGSWQIVAGKLGSALLQMLVYLSAMAPCLAFTYLLRGIDLPTILFSLLYVFMASLGLSLIGLLLATVTQQKHWQIVLLVLLLGILLFAAGIVCTAILEGLLYESNGLFDNRYFYIFNGVLLTIYLGYFALFYCLAAGRLTFASENRSTPSRIVMLAQQAMFFGWMAWGFLQEPASEWWLLFTTICAINWYVMGIFLTSEDPELSPRVQRRLPRSFLGRLFFSWFTPGPGSGYMFVLANLAAAILLGAAFMSAYQMFVPGGARFGLRQGWRTLLLFALLAYCYTAIYLGLGQLILAWMRRRFAVSEVFAVLLQALLQLLLCAVPAVINAYVENWRENYTLLQFVNPWWTIPELWFSGLGPDPWLGIDQELALVLTVPPLAALIIFVNLRGVAEEVRKTRIAPPVRVLEEDAALHAKEVPTAPVQVSPWDFETPEPNGLQP
ncbi:MAG: ABC transporter permease [Pirellulales bacterium]